VLVNFTERAFVLFVCVSTGTIAAAGAVLHGAPQILYTELFAIEFAFAVLLGLFAWSAPHGRRRAG
jgi:hypothetical protein